MESNISINAYRSRYRNRLSTIKLKCTKLHYSRSQCDLQYISLWYTYSFYSCDNFYSLGLVFCYLNVYLGFKNPNWQITDKNTFKTFSRHISSVCLHNTSVCSMIPLPSYIMEGICGRKVLKTNNICSVYQKSRCNLADLCLQKLYLI